jgi:hypothetical protein
MKMMIQNLKRLNQFKLLDIVIYISQLAEVEKIENFTKYPVLVSQFAITIHILSKKILNKTIPSS